MFHLGFLIHNDLDLYLHQLYMTNKRVWMKVGDSEWQFWAEIVWLNCLVVYLSMGVYITHFNEHKKSSQARI